MKSRHLVDPQFLPLLESNAGITIEPQRIIEARVAIVEMFKLTALPEAKPTRVVTIPRPDGNGSLALRVFIPSQEARVRPAILEIHSGGFIIGEASISDTQNFRLAKEHDAVVVAVDYRLAPECPFPGPIEDCYAGLAWIFHNAQAMGIDVERVALFGASAGGGLAAALAQLVRDRNEYALAAQFLIYPMLDCRTGSDDDPYRNPFTGEYGWTRENNRYGWASMRGSEPIEASQIGYFSPSLSKSLAGLPQAFIAVGTLDLFLDEDVAYAARLIQEGVPTELHVYPGAPHGFDMIATADVAQSFQRALSEALKRTFAVTGASEAVRP